MSCPDYCSERPFDARHLGRPVWALTDPARAVEAVAAANSAKVGLLFYRGVAEEGPTLQTTGFREIETLVTYEMALDGGREELPTGTRLATASDADRVGEIAGAVFQTDRWHADPNIPNDTADAFKRDWARNNVLGRGVDTILSVEGTGLITGFNALLSRADTLIIDLIGVAAEAQGKGYGRRLVTAALSYGRGRYARLEVGTQAANTASCALYASLGMQEVRRQTTWHWTP